MISLDFSYFKRKVRALGLKVSVAPDTCCLTQTGTLFKFKVTDQRKGSTLATTQLALCELQSFFPPSLPKGLILGTKL